jgi:hypothetical protein
MNIRRCFQQLVNTHICTPKLEAETENVTVLKKKIHIFLTWKLISITTTVHKTCLFESHIDSQANYVVAKRHRQFYDKAQNVQFLPSHRKQTFSGVIPSQNVTTARSPAQNAMRIAPCQLTEFTAIIVSQRYAWKNTERNRGQLLIRCVSVVRM